MSRSGSVANHGIALVAVLIALALLMALVVPFTASMSYGSEASVALADARTADVASASVRDLLVSQAALGHPALDPTPTHDTRDEYPDRVVVPEAFAALTEGGRVRLGGEVEDLQRRVHLDAVTPLLLCNLLDTTARLREDLPPEGDVIPLANAGNLPEQGFVWIDHEVVFFTGRSDSALTGLSRGAFAERGFLLPTMHEVKAGALVLDFRAILAVSWPFDGRTGGARDQRRPFTRVAELAEIATAGTGAFTPDELDLLQAVLTADGGRDQETVWGRPERVFGDLTVVPPTRTLRVKSAVHLGAGSTVRLRDLRTGVVEYNLVMAARTERGQRDLLLPSEFFLEMLLPVGRDFPAIDTVVEPLLPPKVNWNTAEPDVMAAMCAGIRRSQNVREHGTDGRDTAQPQAPISWSEARAMAEQVVVLRQLPEGDGTGPLRSFRDFAERIVKPRLDEAQGFAQKNRWLLLYRALLTGRDSAVEMGTAPLGFESGPWVRYRAAASVSRSALATTVAARTERQGIAAAVPGFGLEHAWRTQAALEEAFRLDQRAAYWSTFPVNTGAVNPSEQGNDPSSRSFAHLIGMAFPNAGLGEARFPSEDTADSGFALATAMAPWGRWGREPRATDHFGTAIDPRGFDVTREGPYRARNNGPRDRGGQPQQSDSFDHSRIQFPFSVDGGGAGRFATAFWAEAEQWNDQVLLEYGDGDRDRNRIALLIRQGQFVLEVLGEAGIDPDPGQSVTSPQRTATEWRVPLSDVNPQPRVPLHFNAAAYSSRPTDLSLFIDGVPRGKPQFVTHLTAPVPVYDPVNQTPVGPNPTTSDPRYLDLYVESTDGFPPQGLLRVGLELFEYTAVSPGVFHCQWADSRGGRMARMAAFEFRPNIPTDAQGRPTVDVSNLPQGVTLDVAPEHPVGSAVELCGYATMPSPDTPVWVGDTRPGGALGAFAIGRGFVRNPVPIVLQIPRGPGLPVGAGIDISGGAELELSDPLPTRNYPPNPAQARIADAFAPTGGYALLMQRWISFDPPANAIGAISAVVGGVEVIKYSGRQGTKLTGVQRASPLPGDNSHILPGYFDGTARRFVCDWEDNLVMELADGTRLPFDEVPQFQLFVVPISLGVQGTATLPDPVATGFSEWVQLYPQGDENDTEWVRYDLIQDGSQLVRSNRARWERTRFELTRQTRQDSFQLGALGVLARDPSLASQAVWGQVTATSGYIGYIEQLESEFPQIRAARLALQFRGDPFTGTSSHAHQNSVVLPCHRFQLTWGNYGCYSGRLGRQDRVTLIEGANGSGSSRPRTEWHTVNWTVRRFGIDAPPGQSQPAEYLGPWPFQLVGLKQRVASAILGPSVTQNAGLDPRLQDRVVKFPSGELPAAFAEDVTFGGPFQGGDGMRGLVDEVTVVNQLAFDLTLDEPCDATAREFRTRPDLTLLPTGAWLPGGDLSAQYPPGGGLLAIDGEVLAFQSRQNGVFQIANNGRGLLGTTPRGHDRGARVQFLTHVPAAILAAGVQPTSDILPVQALGAMPVRGTALLGRELLHYTWTRRSGDQVTFEMPRHFPPGEEPGEGGATQGLFRGRYGTTPQGAGQGEVLIGMPFRFWDRYAERADDPEMSYFQLTRGGPPSFWKSVRWTQETTDATVEVLAMARVDQHGSFANDPQRVPGLFQYQLGAGDDRPRRIDYQGSLLELRFFTVYRPGAYDPALFAAHGWKTAPRIKDVRVEYEGQGVVVEERITVR